MKRLILLLLVLAASVSAQVDLRGFGSPYWESSGDSVVMKAKWAYLDLDGQVIIVDSMHVITILADTLFSVYDTTQIALMDSIYGAGGELVMDTDGNLILLGWIDADSLNAEHLVINADATIDSVNADHIVSNVFIDADSVDTEHLVVNADATIDSVNVDHAIVNAQVDADSVNADHLVVNTNVSLPAGSLEAADIALAQNNILVGNGSGQAAAATDLPTATTIGTAYVYRVSGTDVSDADVVDALTISGGTVNNSIIGGSVAAAGTFTDLAVEDTLLVLDGTGADSVMVYDDGTNTHLYSDNPIIINTQDDAMSYYLSNGNLYRNANDNGTLGLYYLRWKEIYASDMVNIGGKGQSAALYLTQNAMSGVDFADSSWVMQIDAGVPKLTYAGTDGDTWYISGNTSDEMTLTDAAGFTINTGAKLKIGTLQWTVAGSDSIDGAKLARADFGDVTVDDGSWTVEDDSHDHTTTISGNAANVSDADFGDVSVSSGIWTVDAIDSVWNKITLGNDAENVSGSIDFVASDNDLGSVAITTDDILDFDGFSGGLQYDSHILGYQASLGHGMTAIMGTDNFMKMTANDGGNGGTTIWSASTSSDGDDHALALRAITTDATITEPIFEFMVAKNSGTTWTGIGGTYPAFVFRDGTNELAILKTSGLLEVGSVAIGDTTTGAHDAILYFADDGSGTAESIKWDDGTEKFIASDDLDVTGRLQIDEIYHIYGGFEDSSAAVAITQDQWSQVTNAWGTLFGGSESDGFAMANDTVVVTNAGDYEGMVSLTFSGTNSNEYVFRIYDATTDAQKGFKLGVTADGTTNHAHISIPVYIEAAGNDSLVLQVTNTSGSNAATFEFGQFLLKYLHD